MDPRDPDHLDLMQSAPPPEASAVDLALRSPRGVTDLGLDRRAPPVLEVAQIWADTLLAVRHFEPDRAAVTLGDPTPRRRLGVAAALVAILMVGLSVAMLRHGAIHEPPPLTGADEALIAAWTAEAEQARAARVSDPPTPATAEVAGEDPLEIWATDTRQEHRKALERAERAMAAGRQDRALLELPPFRLEHQPGWETFVAEALVPAARARSEVGALPKAWVNALERAGAPLDVLDEPGAARIAEDLPLGTRVRRTDAPDAPVWMIVEGLDPDAIVLADGSRSETIAHGARVWPWVPSETALADHAALRTAAWELLYADAIAARSPRRLCEAVEARLSLRADSPALQARAAGCALDRGSIEAAATALIVLAELRAGGAPWDEPDAQGVALRAHARVDLLRFEDAPRGAARAEARDAAIASVTALRAYVIGETRSVADLRSAARDLQLLGADAAHEAQERVVSLAGALAAVMVLLLPLGIVWDERAARRSAPDFAVDEDALPVPRWPLVRRRGGETRIALPPGATGWKQPLDAPADRAPIDDRAEVTLLDGEQLVAELGGATFVIQSVPRARRMPDGGREVDWPYLGVLAALLFLSAAFTVVLSQTGPEPRTEVAQLDQRLIRIALTEAPTPPPVVDQPRRDEDTGEGKRAPDPEGQRGRPEATRHKAKGARVAVRRQELDREIALRSGLLADLDRMNDRGIFGQDGERSDRIQTALGGLIGTQYGDQRGDGSAPRGDARGGGCMGEDCGPYSIGGTGTRGRGGGSDADGREPGDLGDRGVTGPQGGVDEPILLGGVDKASIDRVVKLHLPQIRYCYERELGARPDLAGKVTVKFVIGKDGSVSTATSAHISLDSPTAERCIHERFLRMRFPAPRGGGIAIVRYPLVFDVR